MGLSCPLHFNRRGRAASGRKGGSVKDNNQPAFPRLERAGADAHDGMTLRDYFAAKALQALLHDAGSRDGSWHIEATAAYEIADAMLEARSA